MTDPDPLPEVADLAPSLIRLRRKTKEGRAQLANHWKTRALVKSASDLIEQQFLGRPLADGDERDLLRFLSYVRVVDGANREYGHHEKITVGAMRDRWEYQPYFVADLINFMLRDRHWSLRADEKPADQTLTQSSSLAAAIHAVAMRDLEDNQASSYRLQLVLTATAARDPVVRDALHDRYETLRRKWASMYTEVIERRQLRLRPGIDVATLTELLSGVAEGLAVRRMADPTIKVVDEARQTSLLGTAAIAIMLGVLERGDGLSVEDLIDQLSG